MLAGTDSQPKHGKEQVNKGQNSTAEPVPKSHKVMAIKHYRKMILKSFLQPEQESD